MSNKSLEGQVAVVTGGSRGIGAAVCARLGELGAMVIVNYSASAAGAEKVVSTITTAGGKAEALQFDVSNSEAVDKAFAQILDRHGRVDVLVNNAGVAIDGLLVRTKDQDWTRTIDINLSGAFYCARAVAKPMMKARRGRIINLSSVIGLMGNAGQAAYSASKAGIFGLTKSLAKELASRNVTVNAIAPGYIDTDMTASLTDDLKKSVMDSIPLNRIGTPDDIAGVVAFLSSKDAEYITGTVINVTGGMYM